MIEMIQEPAEDLRRLELARLDEMQKSVYPRAAKGDRAAADVVLRIMKWRAFYLGFEAPKRVPATTPAERDGPAVITPRSTSAQRPVVNLIFAPTERVSICDEEPERLR
jgi:hypothetical protein